MATDTQPLVDEKKGTKIAAMLSFHIKMSPSLLTEIYKKIILGKNYDCVHEKYCPCKLIGTKTSLFSIQYVYTR